MRLPGRREFLGTSAAGATIALGLGRGGVSAAADVRPPNLLFVLADQWRFSAFGHGTDEVVRTPHIDRLAQDGTLCKRAYAANPVCTPNRSCLLTGRYSHQHGMIKNDLMLPPSEICWPEIFRDAGYATHYVGKWHMDGTDKPGFVPPGWRRRGFDTFEGFNRGHIYHRHWGFDNDGRDLAGSMGDELPDPYYEPALQTDLAIRFMRAQQNKPFCCYVSWGPPHTPFNPPDAYELYTPGEIRHRENVPDDHRPKAAKELAGYFGLCESLDYEMGRLTSFLDEAGLAENTLVVFTADHGELAGSHGKYRKGEPEDESLHVPLVMRLPGTIASGRESETLINSIDLMPTMLSLCGLDDPGTCTGRDLSSAMTGRGAAPSVDSVYCEGKVDSAPAKDASAKSTPRARQANTWRSLVTDQFKLVVRHGTDQVEQLFDLKNDPFETENHANNPSHNRVQSELLAEYRDWAERTADTYPFQPQRAKALYSDAEAEQARS